VQPLPEAAPGWKLLERDTDGDASVGIPAVVHVVAVIHIGNIDVVVVVPIVAPIFGPWVKSTDPVAVVPEAGISSDEPEWQATDSEAMLWSKVSAITVIRNAVTVVAAALLPRAVVRVPVL
jgi:hypothetical protein